MSFREDDQVLNDFERRIRQLELRDPPVEPGTGGGGGDGCQCVFQAGCGITVTGDGSEGSPYIVSAQSPVFVKPSNPYVAPEPGLPT